jgi:hypothetical protein
MTTTIDQLSKQIEQVIQEHLAASQQAATDTIARTFGLAEAGARHERLAPRPAGQRRRPRAEIAALGEQFYRAVCAKPGETMAVLAADIGSSPRELNRPMTQLKSMGQVRSVGLRHLTKYFPMATAKS